MNEARKHNSPIVTRLREERNWQQYYQTERNMRLALRIAEAIKAKGLSKKDFAQLLGKQPSEVTKWLSGTHNFTLDTITMLEIQLSIPLLIVPTEAIVSV